MNELTDALIQGALIVVVALIGYLSKLYASYLKREGLLTELDNKQAYVNIVVTAIQQIYKEADGPEKLNKAKTQLIDYFKKHKINFTEQELDILIESAVKSMKDGFREGASVDSPTVVLKGSEKDAKRN